LSGVDSKIFTGFILQARLVRLGSIVGSWIYDDDEDNNIGTIQCFSGNVYIIFSFIYDIF
jgi:hypothetical protein